MSELDPLPEELLERDQWVCWRLDTRNGKETKIPIQADGETHAKSNDPSTWSSIEAVAETAKGRDDRSIGFMFSDDGPYAGVDLDDCRDPDTGELDDWAQHVVDRLRSYTEVSYSGTGLHIILRDVEVPDWWTNQKDGEKEIEVYDSSRFFTVTADPVESTPSECQSPSEFEDWLREEGDPDTEMTGQRDTDTISRESVASGNLSVYDVVSRADHPPGERTGHPFHGSDTGANFKVDEGGETWRCWRHDVTGNAHHLAGIEQDVIDCGDWDHGGLSDREWAEIYDTARHAGYDLPQPDDDRTATVRFDGGITELPAGTTVEDPSTLSLPEGDSLEDLSGSEIAYHATEHIASYEGIVAMKDTGELYACHDGVWEPDGKNELRQTLRSLLGAEYSQYIRREVTDQIKATRSRSRAKMGVPSGTIAVANGLLDLDDAELRSLRPDHNALWRMPVEYEEDADCPAFKEFLQEVCPDEDRSLLQEFVGYCLLHDDVPHERALMLLGPTDAGKSVFLDVVAELFGRENVASQSIQYLVNERWGLAELEGTPVNIRHDLDPAVIRNTGKAKEIISGNQMQAERKNQDPFDMRPTTKHIFSANRAPERDTDDEAFWNRWLTVVFPETIPRDEQEPMLTESLTTDSELSGILNWAIEGYQRLTEQGHFTNEPTPAENKERWEKFGSSIEQFLDAEMVQDSDAQVPKSEAYDAYTEFASDQGMEVVSQSKFTSELKRKDGIGDSQRRIDGEKLRVYTGVRLCENSSERDG